MDLVWRAISDTIWDACPHNLLEAVSKSSNFTEIEQALSPFITGYIWRSCRIKKISKVEEESEKQAMYMMCSLHSVTEATMYEDD